MATRSNTEAKISQCIDRKQNFILGNVSGKWANRKYFSGSPIGRLNNEFSKTLKEHNRVADLFVVYSYGTPIAWFSLQDSDSEGTNKWYMPKAYYTSTTTNHQHVVERALRGHDIEILESEKE